LAERGLFVYDWTDVYRTLRGALNVYEPAATPSQPIAASSLPSNLAALANAVQLTKVVFAAGDFVDIRAHVRCVERDMVSRGVSSMRTVKALQPVEWYDGIVTGFLRLNDEIFCCVLLAFDANRERRCYLLMSVDSSAFPDVPFDEFDGFFRSKLEAAFAHGLPLYVTADEPLQGRSLSLRKATGIERSGLASLQFPRIDEAVLEASVTQWLAASEQV
jgi:hypothetical protein